MPATTVKETLCYLNGLSLKDPLFISFFPESPPKRGLFWPPTPLESSPFEPIIAGPGQGGAARLADWLVRGTRRGAADIRLALTGFVVPQSVTAQDCQTLWDKLELNLSFNLKS